MKRAASCKRGNFLVGVAAGVASIGVVRFPAGAAEFSYKIGHGQVADHPINIRLNEAAATILKETGGRLEVKVYSSGQLGGDLQMLSQVRLGALEFLCIGDSILASVVPVAALTGMPFAFTGYADQWRVMDGEFGRYVYAQVAKSAGLYVFEKGWDIGFRQVSNVVRPIQTADDLKGLKIRVPEAPVPVALFKALGASPTPVDYKEAYVAMQTHLVDGIELPLVSIETAKFYEISKYVTMTNHMGTTFEFLVNPDAWQRLPRNVRDVAERTFNAAAIVERADVARGDEGLAVKLKSQGMLFNNPNVASFRAAVRRAGLYAQWRNTYGAEPFGILEKAVGKLA